MCSLTAAVLKNNTDYSIESLVQNLVNDVLVPESRNGKDHVYVAMRFPLTLQVAMRRSIDIQAGDIVGFYDLCTNLDKIAEKLKTLGYFVTLSPSLDNTKYEGVDPFDLSLHVYMLNGRPRKMDIDIVTKIRHEYNKQCGIPIDLLVSWENGEDSVATGKRKAEGEEHEEGKAKRPLVNEDEESNVNTVTSQVHHEDDVERA